jgi:hydroxymethylpyrimidine pyrophosphatase-like HAD family hydrolase
LRYFTLVCDYDGTLAHDGQVSDQVIRSLERLLSSGRKLIMVTGRELDDLKRFFHHIDLFERVVAENGALLYRPADHGIKKLAEPPPPEFIAELGRRGVNPISVGNGIVSTWQPHETIVLEAIRDFGIEMQVIFNKGAVMVLPSGVNKATGLREALNELRLSRHNAVGIGDAENDHAFLSLCECAVAVANALPMIKERCDLVTSGDHGLGVIELIDRILATDLSEVESRSVTHAISIGTRADGQEVYFNPYGINILLAGSSQGGKTTLATGIIERLVENDYQLCVIDPEGDYSSVEGMVSLGDRERVPSADEVLEILAKPEESVVCNLLGLALEHRPTFFVELFPRLQELRARTGRPHWIVIDEAHHLLPSSWEPVPLTFPQGSAGMMFITLKAEHVSRVVLSTVDTIIAIGEAPEKTIHTFCDIVGERRPPLDAVTLNTGEAIVWSRRSGECPVWIKTHPPRSERRRHHRKYAKGELAPELSFYFRGPEDKLKLRAQNLVVFLQLAEGVDDETWLYHLRRGEYSKWFREVIKDEDLAVEAAHIEQQEDSSANESQKLIRAAIERRYTAPA